MTPSNISFRDDILPGLEPVLALYRDAAWTAYTSQPLQLRAAIRASSYVASAWNGDELVGLARTLSDETTIMYLQDILVKGSFQRQGIGRKLLQMCLDRYAHVRQFLLLTDDSPQQKALYESMGFTNTQDFKSANLNCFVRFRS